MRKEFDGFIGKRQRYVYRDFVAIENGITLLITTTAEISRRAGIIRSAPLSLSSLIEEETIPVLGRGWVCMEFINPTNSRNERHKPDVVVDDGWFGRDPKQNYPNYRIFDRLVIGESIDWPIVVDASDGSDILSSCNSFLCLQQNLKRKKRQR